MLKYNDIRAIREDLEMGWHVFGLLNDLVKEKQNRLESAVKRLKHIEGVMTTKALKKKKGAK